MTMVLGVVEDKNNGILKQKQHTSKNVLLEDLFVMSNSLERVKSKYVVKGEVPQEENN